MTPQEQAEAIRLSFPMASIAKIYGEYIMDKEKAEEDEKSIISRN